MAGNSIESSRGDARFLNVVDPLNGSHRLRFMRSASCSHGLFGTPNAAMPRIVFLASGWRDPIVQTPKTAETAPRPLVANQAILVYQDAACTGANRLRWPSRFRASLAFIYENAASAALREKKNVGAKGLNHRILGASPFARFPGSFLLAASFFSSWDWAPDRTKSHSGAPLALGSSRRVAWPW